MTSGFVDRPSPNQGPRKSGSEDVSDASISLIVLHYTGMQSCEDALTRLCDPDAQVSAHYLIDEDGTIYQMVPESQRAWHAGKSFWRGISDVNSASIGIELVNPGHEYGYQPFPSRQIEALTTLCRDIMDRHGIRASDVIGHSDVAPGRKLDPGELFPWQDLATSGIGVWPPEPTPAQAQDDADFWAHLAAIGYACPGQELADHSILDPETGRLDVVTAFQRRFRPWHITGDADPETMSLVAAVAELCS